MMSFDTITQLLATKYKPDGTSNFSPMMTNLITRQELVRRKKLREQSIHCFLKTEFPTVQNQKKAYVIVAKENSFHIVLAPSHPAAACKAIARMLPNDNLDCETITTKLLSYHVVGAGDCTLSADGKLHFTNQSGAFRQQPVSETAFYENPSLHGKYKEYEPYLHAYYNAIVQLQLNLGIERYDLSFIQNKQQCDVLSEVLSASDIEYELSGSGTKFTMHYGMSIHKYYALKRELSTDTVEDLQPVFKSTKKAIK